ncbi:hypothetical protein WS75_30040 [Burkholderia sp. FL-7-2-10-S1-D7]|nr:hypothetical protein WS75_30040 [Burkholderia sp. FL-7-2-10-S1-D7]
MQEIVQHCNVEVINCLVNLVIQVHTLALIRRKRKILLRDMIAITDILRLIWYRRNRGALYIQKLSDGSTACKAPLIP